MVFKIKNGFSRFIHLLWRNRAYLIPFGVLVSGMIIVRLDNPTGIVLGWLAITVLLVAIVRKWRKPWYFLILLLASFSGAIFLSFLDRVVALSLAEWIGGVKATDSTAWRIFHAFVSNIILLVVPMGMLFGVAGFIISGIFHLVMLIRRNRAAGNT